MRWTNSILVLLGAAFAGCSLQAVPASELRENYQSIIERNPFGLKPPPPPATNTLDQAKEKPKTEIFLTGITSIGFPQKPKQAYFYTREQGKKDVTYYALNEGASKDGIRVLDIDPQKRKVRVQMDNSETVLSFETHGVPVVAPAAKPAIPGVPNLPVPGQPGAVQPGVQPVPLPAPVQRGGRASYGQPTAQPLGADSAPNTTSLRQIPSRRIRGRDAAANVPVPGYPGSDGQQQQQQQSVDFAEEYLRIHLNRTAQQQQQNIPLPPLPTME